jgi:hypothetical protein
MRLMRLFAVLILVLSLTGCAATSVTSPDCAWAEPLTWSSRDTVETRQEIFAHNMKWEELCQRSSTRP